MDLFKDANSIGVIKWVFKARAGVLGLNGVIWRQGLQKKCSLCNMDEDEDVGHFIARCPALKEFRRDVFGLTNLSMDQCIWVLNGNIGWDKLYVYLLRAWRYRRFLITEFNF